MPSLEPILKLAAVLVAAVIATIFGMKRQAKKESASQTTLTSAGKVADRQAEAIEEAGRDLAENLAADRDTRRAGVLRWLRNRPKRS